MIVIVYIMIVIDAVAFPIVIPVDHELDCDIVWFWELGSKLVTVN